MNLFHHLQEYHPDAYSEAVPYSSKVSKPKQKQPMLKQVINKAKKYDTKSTHACELNQAVANYLAKDLQPLYAVERSGFKKLVTKLDPKYALPSRNYFSETEIPRLYNEIRDNLVRPQLKEAKYFSSTTDLWTSCANQPYLSLTVHFIDKEWILRSYCLDTTPLFEDHTGQNISEAIKDIYQNWQLPVADLVATTTDNGSNFIAAYQQLNWIRLSCFGHNLDLAIKKSLNNPRVQQSIRKCHCLIELFHRSWKKNRDLHEKQKELGIKEHKLITDVSTRWGSTYAMMERILEQQQAICAVVSNVRKNWSKMPSDAEFTNIEITIAVLGSLSIFTDALSGEKWINISVVWPLLNHILDTLLNPSDDDVALAKEMNLAISNDLRPRYSAPDISVLLDKCTFLDPRFRTSHLNDSEGTKVRIADEAVVILMNTDASTSCDSTSCATDCESTNTGCQPPSKKRKGLGAILSKIFDSDAQNETPLCPRERVEVEISRYLDLPVVEMDSDPLQWWKHEEKRLPVLAVLAKKYLCICGTSVPSERLFSKSGFIVDAFRSRLLPEKVNMLTFLAKNLP